ncbi:MAG: HDOD domain-containing protein [Gammaproteobacteria bacterium]|nr:HDOD domain-containing protein [Gammaproteobacteria bacterium]
MSQASDALLRALRQMTPLNRLSDNQLIVLAGRVDVRRAKAGTRIIERGSADGRDYFLLAGTLRLRADDGRQRDIVAGSESALAAIAHLQPRIYDVSAATDCAYLTLERDMLTRLLQEAPMDQYEMDESPQPAGGDDYRLLMSFYADLRSNQLVLPSLPDLAWRIRRIAEQPDTGLDDLAQALISDPAMAAKLVRACNSPLYRGFAEIHSLREAVVRLGVQVTRQLVTVFSMRELFKTRQPELQDAMSVLWDHSREVAAMAWALARAQAGIDPEEALLAGLLQGIGAIPVIAHAERHVNLFADYRALRQAIQDLRGEIGGALLRHWGFPEVFVEVAEHPGDWMYDHGDERPRLVDVVLLAELHAYIGKPDMARLPSLDSVPAFKRMQGLELTPQKSLRLLQDAREQIASMRDMLRGHG